MTIASGIIVSSSSSSSILHLNGCFQFLLSPSSSSSRTLIQSSWRRRWWRSISMHSPSSSSFAAPAASFSGISASSSESAVPAAEAGEAVTVKATKRPPRIQPWLIVGLGNPGKLYNRTRHNVGFEMVDAIAEAEGISMSSVSFKAFFGKGFIGCLPVMLAKPQTFMNASGESVGAIVAYHKIPPNQVLVIYDDLDLPFAKLRLLPKGGHGGHNGMKSVINHLKGSRDIPRLRIGIGRPLGKMEAASYVLKQFTKQEREELDFTFQTGVEAMRYLVLEGFDRCATFVNTSKSLERLR